ncbi:alpha/beta fold hydrolase [Georgenia soli]|nr:alpha/beta fold hydrolase [Georgenia soli]
MTARLSLTRNGPDEAVPLVLLHAFPLDRRMWDDVLAELDDLPVITLDAPGFGSSPATEELAEAFGAPSEPTLTLYADAVAGTLREAGVDRAVVAGLSMGGYATLALAERHPDLLAGVGLLDTRAAPDPEAAREDRLRVAEEAAGPKGAGAVAPMIGKVLGTTSHAERPEVVEKVRGWLAEAPPSGIAWAQRAMAARPDRLAALEALDVPALVLRGAEDLQSSQDDAESMASALRDVEVVVVPRAGHLSAVEQPQEVATALRALRERCLRA